jgi:hypothetical protein
MLPQNPYGGCAGASNISFLQLLSLRFLCAFAPLRLKVKHLRLKLLR